MSSVMTIQFPFRRLLPTLGAYFLSMPFPSRNRANITLSGHNRTTLLSALQQACPVPPSDISQSHSPTIILDLRSNLLSLTNAWQDGTRPLPPTRQQMASAAAIVAQGVCCVFRQQCHLWLPGPYPPVSSYSSSSSSFFPQSKCCM